MNDKSAIALFCLIDDVLKAFHHKRLRDPSQESMSDSEVVFTGILAARHFACNLRKGLAYVTDKKFCSKPLSESRFNYRLKAIPGEIWVLLQQFLARAAGAYTRDEYIIDSFPIPVCHNIRISRCRILQGKDYRGYCANKKQFFYGLKVHAIVSTTGIPIYFECTPGKEHDLSAFKKMNMQAIDSGVLYGDAAYNDYALEDQLANAGLQLMVQRKQNSTRPHSPQVAKQISRKRKRIETCFSGILRLFPRTLHAVKSHGIDLKITLLIGAFTSIAIPF